MMRTSERTPKHDPQECAAVFPRGAKQMMCAGHIKRLQSARMTLLRNCFIKAALPVGQVRE
ncbi:MAG TPA: hypothetical protein VNY53_10825, partial [Bradyrhizobium sp.]|nr:hypothetical protein [Bradyrhizobium sp.]